MFSLFKVSLKFNVKATFVILLYITLFPGCIGPMAHGSYESDNRQELEQVFESEFGFPLEDKTTAIKAKELGVYDSWCRWVRFTYSDSLFSRIIKYGDFYDIATYSPPETNVEAELMRIIDINSDKFYNAQTKLSDSYPLFSSPEINVDLSSIFYATEKGETGQSLLTLRDKSHQLIAAKEMVEKLKKKLTDPKIIEIFNIPTKKERENALKKLEGGRVTILTSEIRKIISISDKKKRLEAEEKFMNMTISVSLLDSSITNLLTEENQNKPDWWERPDTNKTAVYFKACDRYMECGSILWADENKKFVYYLTSGFD